VILVDTNVLIDLRDRDPAWEPWSMRAVALARLAGPVGTTAVTVGELASRGGTLVELRELCSAFGIPLLPLSVLERTTPDRRTAPIGLRGVGARNSSPIS
jgi:hypothetical protein